MLDLIHEYGVETSRECPKCGSGKAPVNRKKYYLCPDCLFKGQVEEWYWLKVER